MRKTCLFLALASQAVVQAQWLDHPTPGIPRTRDGRPNLAAPAPRAADGKPSLTGLWITESAPPEMLKRMVPDSTNGAGEEPMSQYFVNIFSDLPPAEVPFLPAAAERFRRLAPQFTVSSPLAHCLPEGMPMLEMSPAPYKILQTPGLIAMLYERDTTYRQIYTDGRGLPRDPQPSWLGYSVGKWDGDTLVVETGGLNDRGWLDARGHAHSEALHITERFHRRDFGHLDLQLTFEDPQTYTRPFTVKVRQRLVPDSDLLESYCAENEKDMAHMTGK